MNCKFEESQSKELASFLDEEKSRRSKGEMLQFFEYKIEKDFQEESKLCQASAQVLEENTNFE